MIAASVFTKFSAIFSRNNDERAVAIEGSGAIVDAATFTALRRNGFGEGPGHALVLAVGEQPGDYEDKQGKPFVGPAGRILTRAFEEAGIDGRQVYITNAVKHFKFEPRGKRRVHKKPDLSEIRACRVWLESEIELVKPRLIVALGATAAQTLFEKKMGINDSRGRLLGHPWANVLITIHPSAVLRVPEPDRQRELRGLVQDLQVAAKWLRTAP
jgi:uracil-DNA glycosylase